VVGKARGQQGTLKQEPWQVLAWIGLMGTSSNGGRLQRSVRSWLRKKDFKKSLKTFVSLEKQSHTDYDMVLTSVSWFNSAVFL
jgi:hypothetical protein